MTDASKPTLYGDATIAIYLPSRYRDGAPISLDLLEQVETDIKGILADKFGGSTGTEQLTGTYKHDDGRIIDEKIRRVWSSVNRGNLRNEERQRELFNLASKYAIDLCQEAIAVEWGSELWGVATADKGNFVKRIPFSEFEPQFQEDMVRIALRRTGSLDDLGTMLSLDGWAVNAVVPFEPFAGIFIIAEKRGLKALISRNKLDLNLRRELASRIGEKDFVFDQDDDKAIRIWIRNGTTLRGGRRIPLVHHDGVIPKTSIVLALAILGSKESESIENLIDRSALTKSFFREYRRLRDSTMGLLKKQGLGKDESEREAQLLLGRLMFLRFLEQKGWLANDRGFLKKQFRSRRGNFYQSELDPLFFDVLDVPMGHRKKKDQLPYLNGGLFRRTIEKNIQLPDSLFDPDISDSILGTFGRYEFTMDESTGSYEQVSIDPTMFGHVLEGICAEYERKTKGIHYTPPPIARALAFESIISKVSEIADIKALDLRAFSHGDREALSPSDAKRIGDLLFGLRILDPAVGSGSLLLAALNELMALKSKCADRVGQPIRKGDYAWAETVRKFIRECLFGVDIDANAVEIAKLRLWLAIAVGAKEPEPLPDLEHNIRVGDSLSEIRDPEDLTQKEIAFDYLAKARNRFLDKLSEYRNAEGEKGRIASESLDEAERDYVATCLEAEGSNAVLRRAANIRKGGRAPFFWHIHFADVFRRKNKGFDIVIANPPYISAQNLRKEFEDSLDEYVKRFDSIKSGAKDIYLAFVEQGLKLSGKSGRLAYIMPNFSRTASGKHLREILRQRGAIDLWVDFGDIQVFETSTNYVSLLFADTKKRRRRSFDCKRPLGTKWLPENNVDWIAKAPSGQVKYADIWRTLSKEEAQLIRKLEADKTPLGKLVEQIGVGVQTSADDVFLVLVKEKVDRGHVKVHSKCLNKAVILERSFLKLCAKGSKHLKPYRVEQELSLLWPYDKNSNLISEKVLGKRYPNAWSYLKRCEKRLRNREKRKFDDDRWWRFGREQGRDLCVSPKLLIPSTMKGGMAYFDEQGRVAFTASGKGGGGAWGIIPNKKLINPRWLLAVLNSRSIWDWLNLEGDPKQSGWRGVDKALLERIPVPVPSKEMQLEAAELTRRVEKKLVSEEDASEFLAQLNSLVAKAFRL
ncbi:MAG: Eco57I restriction-modification methylase domain-containing protein [Candidatus Hodarchaeota archaeon]